MEYKINIHAHSIFSDGKNTPFVMALESNLLGFSSLVITDHFYGRKKPEFISKTSMKILKRACKEAKTILPIIIGLEVPFMGQEILIFGGAAIKRILEYGKPNMEEMLTLKKETGCAVILCHPGEDCHLAIPAIDGYERFNSGTDYFKNKSKDDLVNLPGWCNSDAHSAEQLGCAYNIVNKKIETETDLIRYIKHCKQPKFFIE